MVVLLATSGIVSQLPVAFVFAEDGDDGGGDGGSDSGGSNDDGGGDGGGSDDSGDSGGDDNSGDSGGGSDDSGDSGGDDNNNDNSDDYNVQTEDNTDNEGTETEDQTNDGTSTEDEGIAQDTEPSIEPDTTPIEPDTTPIERSTPIEPDTTPIEPVIDKPIIIASPKKHPLSHTGETEIDKEVYEKEKAAIEDYIYDEPGKVKLYPTEGIKEPWRKALIESLNAEAEQKKPQGQQYNPEDDPYEVCDISTKCKGPGVTPNGESNCIGYYCFGEEEKEEYEKIIKSGKCDGVNDRPKDKEDCLKNGGRGSDWKDEGKGNGDGTWKDGWKDDWNCHTKWSKDKCGGNDWDDWKHKNWCEWHKCHHENHKHNHNHDHHHYDKPRTTITTTPMITATIMQL